MSIKEFVNSLSDTIVLNNKVVDALSDIVLSSNGTTSIEYTPIQRDSYYHSTGKESLYSGNIPSARRMFNGKNYISNFNLGLANQILPIGNYNISSRISTLSSINDSTNLKLRTVSSIVSQYSSLYSRAILAKKSNVWRKFKLGEYWPSTVNFTDSPRFQITRDSVSKYSFIKLSPTKDAKYHVISVDVDTISASEIPVIFIVLDSHDAIDGDSFEFKIEYTSANTITDYSRLPEVMFFDSKYNSSAVPMPSFSENTGYFASFCKAVKISGIDYYYINANLLSNATLNKHGLLNSDNVFISAEDLNIGNVNHVGNIKSYNTDNFTASRFPGYGIDNRSIMKVYRNDSYMFTVEKIGDSIDSVAMNHRHIIGGDNSMTFSNRKNTSLFVGRPSSFFKPVLSGSYTSPVDYFAPIEGLTGNTVSQYLFDDIKGPLLSANNNGIVFKFDVDLSEIDGNEIAIRLGHFESIIGLNLHIKDSAIGIFIDGEVPLSSTIQKVDTFKCSVGFIYHLGKLYTRVMLKSNGTILYSSELVSAGGLGSATILNKLLPSNVKASSNIADIYNRFDLFSHWSPVISILIDGSNGGESKITLSNISTYSDLMFHEFNHTFDLTADLSPNSIGDIGEYFNFASSRGMFIPSILKPVNVEGFICSVSPRKLMTIGSQLIQSKLPSYRVGVVYSAYKGSVVSSGEGGQITVVPKNIKTISTTYSNIDLSSLDSKNKNISGYVGGISSTVLDTVNELTTIAGEISVNFSESLIENPSESQIDSVFSSYGWKVAAFNQLSN